MGDLERMGDERSHRWDLGRRCQRRGGRESSRASSCVTTAPCLAAVDLSAVHCRRSSLPSPNLLAVATEAAFVGAVGGTNGRRTRTRELAERVMRDGSRLFRRPCCRAVRISRHGRRSFGLSFCHLRPCCRRRKSMPSPSPELGHRSRWRWLPGLPPNRFRGRYYFVFVLHVAVVIAKVAGS
ncbi:uncharacterized protein LOC107618828 [Arachis ipaensis]|uniref:uncharacterized protein LOC107618828 n=1 Tax=Arachis ipaensis TaxID=130454 RepID=UPI0007AFBE13|nr:uncharacterized protein LOC107618828 [Arachis ipaensis]XP_020978476.1 uncharacterized protein LOC107618828 [Arachis ipaensis]XP_025629138.1 uncharacterized protein LOC112722355 [Arachis hypogaea]QHO20395.1 uncharacterized protein DS421_11g337590 [Arachis hypogaea]QHO20396.1 uncharacterized protein DS421_11g337590 [Arachis hypogaea]